jgi:hypothetical protein
VIKGSLSKITSTKPKTLGKTFSLSIDGRLNKATAGQLLSGSIDVLSFDSAAALGELLQGFGPDQALCASVPASGLLTVPLVTRKALASTPGAIARTKEAFAWPDGPGPLALDYDPPKLGEVLSPDDLYAAVVAVAPGLADAGCVWWASGLSCIVNTATGEELAPMKGQRLYLMLAQAADGPRCLQVLNQRLWLAGHGRVEVSASGALLVRSLFDEAMGQTARLDFAPAGSICEAPLQQQRGQPRVLSSGGFADSRAAVPDLSADELGRYQALVEEAKEGQRAAADAARGAWKAARVAAGLPGLMQQGISAGDAEARLQRCIDAAFSGVLLGDFVLTLVDEDGARREVTVSDVLADRLAFNGLDLLDPVNPGHRDGSPDARLYLLGCSPIAYSLDEGGQVYRLRRQHVSIEASRGHRQDLVDRLRSEVIAWDDVFKGPAGLPVVVDGGRLLPLTVDRLSLAVGSRCALFTPSKEGRRAAYDLPREAAQLLLALLQS